MTILFFDLDQTLVDYRQATFRAAEQSLPLWPELAHIPPPAWATAWNQIRYEQSRTELDGRLSIADLRRQRMRMLAQTFALSGDASSWEALGQRFAAAVEAHCHLFPDVAPALAHLSPLRMGLITNGEEATQRRKLRWAGLQREFQPFICSVSLGVAKPAQAVFQAALAAAKMPPTAAWMVGDSLKQDIYPALALGMRAVWLNRTPTAPPPMGVCQIGSLVELVNFI